MQLVALVNVVRTSSGRCDRSAVGEFRGLPHAAPVRVGPRSGHAVFVVALSLLAWVAVLFVQSTPAGAASPTAPAVSQCDPPDFPTGAGFQVTCTVTVVNNVSSVGATSSSVTISACLAAAGVVFPSCPLNSGPVTNVTSSTQLVTSVDQCNGIVNGGGSNVYCNVSVTNNVPTGTSPTGVSIDQCIGSANGLGSTQVCAPGGSTTSATVTQCNGSGTGGGTYNGETTVGCTVTGATSAELVTVNQCNGTSTGGGSAVTCGATFANNFITPVATTTTTTAGTSTGGGATTTTTAAAGAAGTTSTTASGGTGSTGGGGTGGNANSGGNTSGSAGQTTTTTAPTVVPLGIPHTGAGGAAHVSDNWLVVLGALALLGAAGGLVIALRRRRAHGLEPNRDE